MFASSFSCLPRQMDMGTAAPTPIRSAREIRDRKPAGIDAQMIPLLVSPLEIRNHLLGFCPGRVYLAYLSRQLLVRQVLILRRPLPAARHLGLHIRVDENIKGLFLFQDLVGSAAHNHTVLLFGHLLNHFPLRHHHADRVVAPFVRAELLSLERLGDREREQLTRLNERRTEYFRQELEEAMAANERNENKAR